MSKRSKKMDPNQMQLELIFETKVDRYVEQRREIQEVVTNRLPARRDENDSEFELCVEIAASIKHAIRKSGLSRDQVVDGVNDFFNRNPEGAKEDPPRCRNPLTINMLNKYLCKSDEAPIPAYYLVAIMHVCNSLAPAQTLLDPVGGRAVSGQEVRQLTLGKIDHNISELQKLKKELKGR